MAATIWTGTISFGLISIPVSLATAEKTGQQLDFNWLDKRDHAHVGYQKINKTTGEVIKPDQIVKGLKLDNGSYALFDEGELKKLRLKGDQSFDIQQFVAETEVDPMYFEKPYYMLAGKGGTKPYILLREALKNKKVMGVGLINIHSKQRLGCIRAMGPALVLELVRFDHELRKTSDYDFPAVSTTTAKITTKEIAMAEALIDEHTAKWNPKSFKDTYYDDVMKAVKKKKTVKAAAGDDATEAKTSAGHGNAVLDLMPLLERSLKKKAGSARKSVAKRNVRKKVKA